MDLTDTQWAELKPLLQVKPRRKRGRLWRDARAVFNGILWVLRTGAPWHDLPDGYCRRWKIERLFAWLHNFRRLVVRWEYYEENFLAMI